MPATSLERLLKPTLAQVKAQGLYRKPKVTERLNATQVVVNGQKAHCFCSNDYLGLATHPQVQAAMQGGGSGAAHLVSGHSPEHAALEEELAAFVQRPRALLFSTGYMANIGVIDAITRSGDWHIHSDSLNHASLIDGCRISKAQTHRWPHGDLSALRQNIDANTSNLIISDGVFSMDGDIAPLQQLAQLPASLMVDDAHGFGVLGPQGRGTLHHLGVSSQVPILMGTLGKAIGTFGAFVAGSEDLIEFLIQRARTYIYTTATPPAIASATRVALKLCEEETWRREQLSSLVSQFRQGCEQLGYQLGDSTTPIQPIIVGDATETMSLSQQLLEKGFWVSAIRPPTVPDGTSRLRVTFSAEHSETDVAQLLNALEACKR